MTEPLELRIVGRYASGVIAANKYDRYIIEEQKGFYQITFEYKVPFLPLPKKANP